MGSTLWVLITLAALSAWPFSAWAASGHAAPAGMQGVCPLADACAGGLRPERVGLTSLSAEPQRLAMAYRGELGGTSHVLATFAFESGAAEEQTARDSLGQNPAWGRATSWPDLHWSVDAGQSNGEAMQVAAVGSLSYRVFEPTRGLSSQQANGQSGMGDGGSPARGVSDALIAAVLALIGVVAVARRTPMKA